MKIAVAQPFQLFYQRFALAIGDMLGKQQTVNQKPELRIRKIPFHIKVMLDKALLHHTFFVGIHPAGLLEVNGKAHLPQGGEVSLDAFPVSVNTVILCKDFSDVILIQGMFRVGIAAQDFQNGKA